MSATALKLDLQTLEAVKAAVEPITMAQNANIHTTLDKMNLRDQTGRTFNASQTLKGSNTFVLFGFNTCKDICPMTTGNIADAYKKANPKPKIVVISIHPQEDQNNAAEYIANYKKAGITANDITILFAKTDSDAQNIQRTFNMRYDPNNTNGHSPTVITVGSDGYEKGKRVNGMDSDAPRQLLNNLRLSGDNAPSPKKSAARGT